VANDSRVLFKNQTCLAVFNLCKLTNRYPSQPLLANTAGSSSSGDTGLIGLTGQVESNGTVELYATTEPLNDLGNTAVVEITDTLSATSPGANESFQTILQASPGENIRGIAFAPSAYAPTITGTVAGQTTAPEAPVTPFFGVTITDQNSNAVDTLTITYSGPGALADGASFTGTSSLSGASGDYTLTGTAGAITTELDALSFTPVDGVPNTSVTTTFTLSDLSSAYSTPAVDSTTTVVDSDTAVAPTITGTKAGQTTTSEAPVKPFSGVTITDANNGGTEIDTLSITLSGGGTLSGTGLSGSDGSYTLSGTAAAISSELDALVFTPVDGVPNTSVTTTFTLSDLSSAYGTATVNDTTTVIDSDPAVAPPTITSVTPSVVEKGQTTVIGTVKPGIASATLSLKQTSGAGTLSLVTVNGVDEIIYTAPANVSVGMLDTVSYTITDQYNDAVTGSNTVPVAPATDAIYVGRAGGILNVGNGNSAIDGRAGDEGILVGNGTDVVFAGTNDAIYLGNGNDTVLGGSKDIILAGDGNDTFTTGGGSVIAAGNSNDTVSVSGGSDSLITLGSGRDDVTLTGGTADHVSVGNGNDTVTVSSGSGNTITVGDGNDLVNASSEAHDEIFLGNGNDTLNAGTNETISLGWGTDTVNAGMGDAITLGGGRDTVAFLSAGTPAALGSETINNFNVRADQIDFNTALFANFAAVMHDATQHGANTVITAAPGDTITLQGVALSSLTASNFHFS
jgi:Ca2+-binding RTX toxin-like protein